METVTVAAASSQQLLSHNPIFPPKPQCLMLMNPPLAAFKQTPPLLRRLHRLCTAAASTTTAPEITSVPDVPPSPRRRNGPARKASSSSKVANLDAQQLKVNWLDSLSFPSKHDDIINQDSGWVIGVDPDLSGALAVLNPDNSPQVYDSPHLKVLVGKRIRKRLDAKSIVQLIQSVDAPIGTTVYIEQSIPYPQDGKQGWWSGGFGYGLWIGILVASGYSVVPVPSLVWKNEFKLAGNRSSKDDSRELASNMFPSTSDLLKRKKDHGRAEALLIAAYGKGLKLNLDSSCFLEKLMPAIQDDEQAVTL